MPPQDRLAALRRGVNVTHWFRYPPSAAPDALENYLDTAALERLRQAGFTFIRVPVQPELVMGSPAALRALVTAARRAERSGLAVLVALAPADWRLESRAADRSALLAAWAKLAPALRPLPASRTFIELLNEPVFPNDQAGWAGLQEQLRAQVRAALPGATLVLSGNDWGSIGGLAALTPAPDPDVVYSVHFYDPAELTSLAAWKPDADHAAFARLPFPVTDPADCTSRLPAADQPTAGMWRFYCSRGWNEQAIRSRFAVAAAWARRNRAAILLGEFGASARLDAPARLAWLSIVRRAAETAGMGWALWGYDDVMGFDLPVPPGDRPLDPAVLAALGMAEPWQVKPETATIMAARKLDVKAASKIKSPRSETGGK